MNNLKTYEGFFDFLKKKKWDSISIEHVMDFLLPITDCEEIKSDLTANTVSGIYTEPSHIIGNKSYFSDKIYIRDGWFHIIKTWDQFRKTPKDMTNILFFHLQYCPVEMNCFLNGIEFSPISDEKVDDIMKELQYDMDGICKLSFFIGFGRDEGRSYDKEFSDIKSMIKKTSPGNQKIRNIIVKIEAPGGIEL